MTINKRIRLLLIVVKAFSLLLFTSCSDSDNKENDISEIQTTNSPSIVDDCQKTNCANYNSMMEAQAAFDADPECRKNLDHDGDGKACEEPGNNVTPKPTSTCPTTANCGCSGKNKTPCQSNPCCKWVTGSGCQCN